MKTRDEIANHICETKPHCRCSGTDDECCCRGRDVCQDCGAAIVAINVNTGEKLVSESLN